MGKLHVKQAGIDTMMSNYAPEALAGALIGGGVGAFASKKNRLRNILIGILTGGAAGTAARYGLAGKTISATNRINDAMDTQSGIRIPYRDGMWRADWLPNADKRNRWLNNVADALEKGKIKGKKIEDKVRDVLGIEKDSEAYHNGFLSKCAEYGVDGNALIKQAWLWGSQMDDTLRKMHDEYLRKAYIGGYDQYLPDKYRTGTDNKLGTGIGRWWNGIWHGRRGFRETYRPELERAMDEARRRWMASYNSASPEMQKAMREEVNRRRDSAGNEDLENLLKKSPEAMAYFKKHYSRNGTQPAAGTAQPTNMRPMTREEIMARDIADGKMRIPNIAGHYADKNGRLFRTDGRPLAPDAQAWNMKYEHMTLPETKPAQPAQNTTTNKPPAPLNAPTVRY